MMVRLLKPWKYKRVGLIIADMPDGAANELIKRHFAEKVEPAKPELKERQKKPTK